MQICMLCFLKYTQLFNLNVLFPQFLYTKILNRLSNFITLV